MLPLLPPMQVIKAKYVFTPHAIMHLNLNDYLFGKYFVDYNSNSNLIKNSEILLIFRRVADESSLDTPVRQLALGLCRYIYFKGLCRFIIIHNLYLHPGTLQVCIFCLINIQCVIDI